MSDDARFEELKSRLLTLCESAERLSGKASCGDVPEGLIDTSCYECVPSDAPEYALDPTWVRAILFSVSL